MRRYAAMNSLFTQKKSLAMAWFIVALGALFYCYEYFLRITPSVMSQSLMRSYHIDASGFGKLSVFYYIAYVPMQLFVGILIDRYGLRRLLTVAILLCSVGMIMFASLYSLGVAELGRFLIGLGAAFAFVGALKLVTIWLPADRFASISGAITALGTIGAMIGDVSLSKLVQMEGWQATLYLSAIIGIVLAVVFFLVVRDKNDNSQAQDTHILPVLTFKQLLLSAWTLLKKPQFILNGLVGGLLYLTLSAFAELWGIPYLQQTYHILQPSNASWMVLCVFLGWTIGSPSMGVISDYLQKRCIVMIVGGLVAFVAITLILYVHWSSFFILQILCFFFGFFASAQVLVFALGCDICGGDIKTMAGTAISLTNMFVMLGGIIFQPLVGKLLDLRWHGQLLHHMRIYSLADYRFAMTVLPVAMIIASLATCFIKEKHFLHSANRLH